MRRRTMPSLNIILLVTFVSYVMLQESNNDNNRCLTLDRHGNCSCCKSGFRGQNCNDKCDHCLSRLGTGQSCTHYCKTGYYGTTCDKPCPTTCASGINGPNLCKEKYGLPICVKCNPGYYGKQCDQSCDTNCLNGTCYRTGKCLSCSSNGFYGDNCRLRCSQGCVSGTCNRTGQCTQGCKSGFYGEQCLSTCGSHCQQGKCTSHGFHAYNCTEGCHDGYWGTPCLDKCPKYCTECEQQSGRCLLCMENYVHKPETGKCEKVKERKPAVADGSNLVIIVIIVVVVIVVIIISGNIILVIWKKRRHRHRDSFDRSAEDSGLLLNFNDKIMPQPMNYQVNKKDSRRVTAHFPEGKFDIRIDERKHTAEIACPEREAEDEHMLKLINMLSNTDERHGECVSREILEIKIKEAKRVFVETNGYKEARKTLQQHGYMTITGGVGEGKTTMALMLGVEYRKQGYSIVMVEDVVSFNYQSLLQRINQCFIILDDVFGFLDFRTEVYHLERMINFFELLTEQALRNAKKYIVVLTSQTLKLKEGLKRIRSETTSPFFHEEVRVCLGDGKASLTPDEKLSIFDTHKKHHETCVSHGIRDIKNSKFGFPLICRMIFAFEQPVTTRKQIFTDPLDFVKPYITSLISEKSSKSAACIVMFLYEDKLNLPKIEANTHDKRFENIFEDVKSLVPGLTCTDICVAARSLRGTLFTEGDVIGFAHPVIYDACAIALASLNIALVLKNCTLKFICERVRETVDVTSRSSNDSNTIQIASGYHDIFVQRLMQGIEDGQCVYVAKHPLLKSGPVERLLVERILKNVKMNNSERGDKGLDHDVVQILKMSVHGHISSIYEEIFKTNITCTPTHIHTLMKECSICGNIDALNFILRRFDYFITEPMICEAHLLAVQNRHDKISERLIQNASEATQKMLKYFEAEQVPSEVFYYMGVSQIIETKGLGSVLKLAAQSGKDRAFMMLLKLNELFKEKIQEISEDGDNLLHLACEGGSKEIVGHLLQVFDVNSRGQNDRTPVMKAAYKGPKEVFDLLVTKGANLQLTDNNGDTVLHLACQGGNTSILKHLLPSTDINRQGQNGWTPIMKASIKGHKEAFDILLENRADTKHKDNWGNNLLHLACEGGNTSIVEHLLPLFDINSRGQNGWTPVMIAAYNGKNQVFDMLVSKKVNLKQSDANGNYILHLACLRGNTYIVKYLLQFFDINCRGQNSWTPVMNAAYSGNKEIFHMLISKKADTSIINDCNNSVFHLACKGGNTSIVRKLLSSFDINCQGQNGWTPVMNAAYSGKKEVFDLLVSSGADLTLTDNYGDNILHLACWGGNISIVQQLLPSTDINIRGHNGTTPVMNATYNGKLNVLKLLKQKGADLTQTDADGDNVLHYACHGEKMLIVEYLIPHVEINSPGKNSWTPLMIASYYGMNELFDLLVTKNADDDQTDKYGNTVLHLACQGGYRSIVEKLLPVLDINSRGENERTPIMNAAASGNEKLFDLLVENGADLTFVDSHENTVLHFASLGGNTAIVQQILPLFDINIPGEYNWTPVMSAAYGGKKDVFHMLLEKGADLNLIDTNGDSVLHLACRGGNTFIIKRLLKHFDKDLQGENGMTPVMSAALSGIEEAFDMLVGMSADLTLIDYNQRTVLHFAVLGGNTTIIDNLLPLFDIKIRKDDGRIVYCDRMVIFDMFIRKGPHLALADLVIQNRIYSKKN